MSRGPSVAAAAGVTFAVSESSEVNDTEFTVTPGPKDTVESARNPDPVTVTSLARPRGTVDGVTPVTTGGARSQLRIRARYAGVSPASSSPPVGGLTSNAA